MSTLAKQQWRDMLRTARRNFVRQQTDSAREALHIQLATAALGVIGTAKRIGSYVAVGSEINPQLILGSVQKYASIGLPRVTGPALPLDFRIVNIATVLEPGFANIPAPPAAAEIIWPTVLLVPLLGVDRSGVRLGQGQGHYDATIKALRARGTIFVLGLAYECQLVDQLPHEAHDERLDAVATPERLLTFRAK